PRVWKVVMPARLVRSPIHRQPIARPPEQSVVPHLLTMAMASAWRERDDGQMIDMILRNAHLAGHDELTDLGVDQGRIVEVADDSPAPETMCLAGGLVTPPLVEPHIHLDAVLTVGQPRPNLSGSLFEGIAVWAERVADLTYEDVQSRVRQVLRWQFASGVQHVRSHVDVCD